MVVYNYSGKEINAKIVYYGPALSGKTTNLEWIYSKIPLEYSGKMVSLRTQTDRTIFFDFLPLDLGNVDGFKTRFMLYTVPGQVHYNATRKMVLKGVDGLVFVADSERGRMADNLESLQNLRDNLEELGYDPNSIPLVLQWNKRDLPECMGVDELEEQLNQVGLPSFEACALTGEGVYETLHHICRMMYHKLTDEGDVEAGAAERDGESLFGASVAERLQQIDHPEPTPEPLALAHAAVPSAGQQEGGALEAILGSMAPRTSGTTPSPAATEVEEPPRASPPPPPPTPTEDRTAPLTPAGTPERSTPIPPPPPDESEGSEVAGSSSESDAEKSEEGHGLASELLDQVLERLGEEVGIEEQGADGMPAGVTAFEAEVDPFAELPEPAEGDPLADLPDELRSAVEIPVIEHDVDPIEELQEHSRPVPPVGSGPSAVPESEEATQALEPAEEEPEGLDLITDPLRLSSESSSRPLSGSGPLGDLSTPASNAKILEVPITIDAEALEEGRQLRIVLNLTVKR